MCIKNHSYFVHNAQNDTIRIIIVVFISLVEKSDPLAVVQYFLLHRLYIGNIAILPIVLVLFGT